MTETTLRNVRGNFYDLRVEQIYSFWYKSLDADAELLILRHAIDGTYEAVAATFGTGTSVGQARFPQATTTDKVLFANDLSTYFLWDPTAPTSLSSYQSPTVTSVILPLAPGWYDDAAHWVEFQQDGTNYTWQLRNSADLSTITDVASTGGLITDYFAGYTSGDVAVRAGSVHTRDYVHFMADLRWDISSTVVYIRLNRNDTGHTDTITASYGNLSSQGGFALPHPTSADYSVTAGSTGATTSLMGKYTGDPPTIGDQWSGSGNFAVGSYVGLSVHTDASDRFCAAHALSTTNYKLSRDGLSPAGSSPDVAAAWTSNPSASYPSHVFQGAVIL